MSVPSYIGTISIMAWLFALVGFILTSCGLYFVFIFFAIFLARVNEFAGRLVVSTCFFGIMSVWPFEMGLSSRTAALSLFSSILTEGTLSRAMAQSVQARSWSLGIDFGCSISSSCLRNSSVLIIFSGFLNAVIFSAISFSSFWESLIRFSKSVSS